MADSVDKLLFHVAKNGYSGATDGGWKDVMKVEKLPKFGQSGILYRVPKKGASGNNLYDEWFWTGTEFALFMENVDGSATTGPSITDTNTTYTLVKDPDNGRTIILKGSDGTEQKVTIDESAQVDTNTTYTMDVRDGKIFLIPSEGQGQEFSLPVQDVSGLATKEELQEVKNSIPPTYNDSEIKQEIAGVKASIPAIPTDVSAFKNDAGYLTTHQDISGLATKAEVEAVEKKIPSVPDTSNLATKDELKSVQGTIPAAYNDTALREGLQKVQEDVANITDNNTTYILEKDVNDPYTAHLKGSDGSDQSVTFPDKDTAYDDGPLKKEIADIKASIPAAYDDGEIKKEIADVRSSIPEVSAVGKSGSYNDLTDKPEIPVAYNDSELRALIKDLQDRLAVLEKDASLDDSGVVADVDGSIDPETGTATLSNSTIDDNGIVTLK